MEDLKTAKCPQRQSTANKTIIGTTLTLLVFVLSLATHANAKCDDPRYKERVNQRLAKFEQHDKDRYQEAQDNLAENPFEEMNGFEKREFLYMNVINSAKYDTREIAMKNIEAKVIERIRLISPVGGCHSTMVMYRPLLIIC